MCLYNFCYFGDYINEHGAQFLPYCSVSFSYSSVLQTSTRPTIPSPIAAVNGANPIGDNLERPVNGKLRTCTTELDDELQHFFESALTDKADPMYVICDAFCLMSSKLGSLSKHFEGTRMMVSKIRTGKSSLEKRVGA